MTEVWKPVAGWSWYDVSEFGQVRSVDRVVRFADGRVRPYRGQVLRQTLGTHGYPAVKLTREGGISKICLVHHLAAYAFLGPRPFEDAHIRHLDGNKTNCNIRNLAYGTVRQNRLDNKWYGQTVGRQVLSVEQVEELKDALQRPYHGINRHFARKFGVSDSAISAIKRGISFSDVCA